MNIFTKILLALLCIGIIPIVFYNFLVINELSNLFNDLEKFLSSEKIDQFEKIFSDLRIEAILITAFNLIILVFISILFTRNLVTPINKIITQMKKVGRGKTKAKVEVDTGDEIEVLAGKFNQMAKDIREYHQRLEERRQELQERVNELEKFHSATVGRELTMIELKKKNDKLRKQVKDLKEKLGEEE